MSAPDFTPSMPYRLALPWPGWEGVGVVYDLYQCEAFVDEQPTYMAEIRAARQALGARATELDQAVNAMPAQEYVATSDAYTDDYNAWLRADALRQLAFYTLRVEWPNGKIGKADAPETWKRFPTRFLGWLTSEGYQQARNTLWSTPDPKGPALSASKTPSIEPSTPNASKTE
jgi:hypothetical protein